MATLTAAQRARIERNRLRARALHEARLVARPGAGPGAGGGPPAPAAAGPLDSGGGFLLEPAAAERAPRPVAPPAPHVHVSEQPHCEECARPFPQSYLLDNFDCSVCDSCRDEEGAHSLVTRTEAKSEFLLKDCDLDSRPPPLRCIRRRNPHRLAAGDMRLYLRAQVEARARLVWGSERALEEERARREDKRARARHAQAERRVRALRKDVRSSLFVREDARHRHRWGPERHDADADEYSHECLDCGHLETYEKM